MEACFSQLTLDVIGKAVFNYDFNALNTDSPLIQVPPAAAGALWCSLLVGLCLVELGGCGCSSVRQLLLAVAC